MIGEAQELETAGQEALTRNGMADSIGNLNTGTAVESQDTLPVQQTGQGVTEVGNIDKSITGITGGGRRVDLPMNGGLRNGMKMVHMTVGAERAGTDGAIHITAGENAGKLIRAIFLVT